MNKEKLISVIYKIEGWIRENGLAGYDPYDLKAHPVSLWITQKSQNSLFFTILREFLFELYLLFPKFFRKLLRIRKTINAKAVALYAIGYLNLHKITGKEEYLDKCKEHLNWLLENKTEIKGGFGWGYPFNWQSTKFIPANTPNGIVTTAVGDAFWQYYQFSKDINYLKYCDHIAKFLASLPVSRIEKRGICFSYTPLFTNHVHNLNLFIAEFLYKIGKENDNKGYLDLAKAAYTYTLSDQHTDGSFDYNGPPEKPMNLKDHYHSGYVLRMLNSLWLQSEDQSIKEATQKGYNYYLSAYFKDNRIPKFTPEKVYRIDIHSCSESILCIGELSKTFSKGVEISEGIVEWATGNLMDKRKSYFYHGIFRSKIFGITFKSRIAYSRWGQAWMFRALTTHYINRYA